MTVPAKKKRAGRPPGAKNKKTLLNEMLDSPLLSLAKDPQKDLKQIYDVLVAEAKKGESWAQNIYWNKVLANAQGREGAGPGGVTVNINIEDMKPKGIVIDAEQDVDG
jgi:hypothetical protein